MFGSRQHTQQIDMLQRTGAGLKDAKDAIDQHRATQR